MDDDGFEPIVGFNAGDRFSQWTGQETHDFLVIRGELDPVFTETRRNKFLWEMVSTRMTEIGYHRSPQQCKSKWKNLVTRYKGCESMEAAEDAFPFYNDLQTIFNARMIRLPPTTSQHHDARKRKKVDGETSNSIVDGFKEIMEEYMKRQMEIEMQWMKAYEEREERRRVREREWRQTMEALENERLMMMRWWREREEHWKLREEARAHRRDALITALLDKLKRE